MYYNCFKIMDLQKCTNSGHFVRKLTSKMRTTSLQGTIEMSQCVHYSEVPLLQQLLTKATHYGKNKKTLKSIK